MTRNDLEHLLRAASAITGEQHFYVIGSQAILGAYPDAPDELLQSFEADLVPVRDPGQADLIDGTIGEESPFHRTFGYYAHGVALDVAVLPDGWRDRIVRLSNPNTGGATGLCLDVRDLAVSKLAAGREKDLDFVAAMFRHAIVSAAPLRERIDLCPVDDETKQRMNARLRRIARI